MRRLMMAGMLVASAALMKNTTAVKAFATNGHTWGTYQVPYYVNPASRDLSPNAAITAFQLGAMNWSSQSNANVQLVYAGTTSGSSATLNYKNEVFFRNTSNGSLGAVTYWWYDGTGHLVDADIIFYEGSYVFYAGERGCQGTGEYVEDLATHEFGHVLGLSHSSVGTATMYPTNTYCDWSWTTLDPDDIAGIESLYPPSSSVNPPAAPTQLAVALNTASPTSSLMLTWADNATNESSYGVDISTDGVQWSPLAQLGINAKAYTASGLAAGTQFSFRVWASNAGGNSGYSNVASGTTQTASSSGDPTGTPAPTPGPTPLPVPSPTLTVPAVPTGPGPGNGTTGVNINADLSWSSAGADQYDVYFGTSAQPPLKSANLATATLALPKLATGTTYYWRVIAKNSIGSTSGPVWSFTTNGKKK